MATTVTETIGTDAARDYSTIGGWEAATDNDLVSADEVRVGECYNDSEFDEHIVIFGATTDSTRFRKLTVAEGERHDGTPKTGARVVKATDTNDEICFINEASFAIEWLEMTVDSTAYASDEWGLFGVFTRNSGGVDDLKVRYILAYDFHLNSSSHRFLQLRQSGGTDRRIIGCIVKGVTNTDTPLILCGGDGVDEVYGNTIVGGEFGIEEASPYAGTLHVRNNVCVDAGVDDFSVTVGTGEDTSHNASSDTSAPGSNSVTGITPSNEFEDYTSSTPNWDLHLASGSSLIDAGVDLGDIDAAIDIDGADRHAEAVTWDIGADEEEIGQTTPVSNTSQGHFEALEGILQTSVGLQEAKGLLAVPSAGLHEAKGTQRVSSAGLHEALQGGIVASSEGLLEALGSVAATSAGLHESKGRLVVTSTGLMEFLAAPVVDLSSFLFYWSGETNKRPVVGGDPLYTRDSVRWYLDPNTEKFRRVPAHYSPVSEERSFSGYDVPVLHLERAGIAENQDTNRFDSGSAWSRPGWGFGSDSPVGSVFEGEHGHLFRDPGGTSASVSQTIGTVSGGQETFSVIFEVLRRPEDDRVTIGIRDQDAASFYARLRIDLGSETANVIAGDGGSILRKWNRKGPNGGDVYRVAVRGSGTAGNARRLYIYPAGASSDGTGARVVLHHAQLEEQAWASSPIVSEAAGATRATTDLFFAGGAPVTDSKVVIYGRVWKDFDDDGPGSEPALLTIGDPTGVRLVVYWATDVGFQLVNSSTNVTKTLSPVGDAGDEVEFYWALEPDWRGRVGLRVDGGTPAGEDHDPIAPEGWGENRIYLNRRTSTKKGAARFESVKAYLAGDLDAALDGSEDEDLFDELREHRLDRRGSLYLLR